MKLLDLFCGGGGASFGYELAGFEVTGVDINPQKNYVGDFVCDDALMFLAEFGHEYDAIHASPPCQHYSKMTSSLRARGKIYPDLIAETRDTLNAVDKPYIIENVSSAPLRDAVLLCGTMFNIPTYRHRLFETNWPLNQLPHPRHVAPVNTIGIKPKDGEFIEYVGNFIGLDIVQRFTGLTWLTTKQLSQSIPPQYTRYIGRELMKHLDTL